jgi:hypothetical protein
MTDINDVLGGFLYPIVKDMTGDGGGLDFFNKTVQFSADANAIATSEATFIYSGPPVLKPATPISGDFEQYLEPLGAVQQYSLQQGGQIIPWTELGSKLKRHSRASGQYSASLARVHTRHSDLKWAVYGWLRRFVNNNSTTGPTIQLGLRPSANSPTTTEGGDFSVDEGRQWVGLESDIFGLPFGLLCITGSAGGKIVHIEYLEDCYIQSAGRGLTAGNAMVVPNISISVNRPVAFTDSSGKTLISGESLQGLQNLRGERNYSLGVTYYGGGEPLGQVGSPEG